MAFESLLGNERVKQNLSAAAAKNRFAHFYLISGPKGSGKHSLHPRPQLSRRSRSSFR